MAIGKALYRTGMLVEAARAFQEALGKGVGEAEAHFHLGLVALRQGDPQGAAEEFKKFLEIRPNSLHGFNNLSISLERAGRLGEAALALEEALKIAPTSSRLRANLGITLYRMGNWEEALGHLEKALRSNRALPFLYLYLGLAYLRTGSLDRAQRTFRSGLEVEPQSPSLLTNYAYCLRETGQEKEAIQTLKEALKYHPDLLQAYLQLGDLLCRQGDLTVGVMMLRRGAGDEERVAEILLSAGTAVHHRGERRRALEIWQRGLELATRREEYLERIARTDPAAPDELLSSP